MCGRYTLTRSAELLGRLLDMKVDGGVKLPAYNACPGQTLPVVLDVSPKMIVPAQWGFRSRAGSRPGRLLINARAESVHQRPAFRQAFRRRRCLVLADGFYEWKSLPGERQPYRFTLTDHGVFAFAGVWSEGDVPTYVILTTRANGLTVQVHDRMPVMLARSAWPGWLGRDPDPEEAFRLLGPYPEERMEGYPVGRAVNHSGNQGPELIEAVDSSGRPGRDRR